MKVLFEGFPKYKNWWHGKVVKCKFCGRTVELEPDDASLVVFDQISPGWIAIRCGNCGGSNDIYMVEPTK